MDNSRNIYGGLNSFNCLKLGQAQRDLEDALHDAGNSNINGPNRMEEIDICMYWYNYVYYGWYDRSSEKAQPHAERR